MVNLMSEQIRIGDIVVDLRTSYETAHSSVKIERLKIDGTPNNPTITMELKLAVEPEVEQAAVAAT